MIEQYKLVNDFLIAQHNYDYGKGDNAEALNANLDSSLKKIIAKMRSEDREWSLISHSITQLKGAVLLSVLFQR